MQISTTLRAGAFALLCAASTLSAQPAVDGFQRGAGVTTASLAYSHENYDTYWVRETETQNTGFGSITTQSVSLYAARLIRRRETLDDIMGLMCFE